MILINIIIIIDIIVIVIVNIIISKKKALEENLVSLCSPYQRCHFLLVWKHLIYTLINLCL